MAWGSYPPYLEKRPRDRVVAVWDCHPSSMIVTEDGELRPADTWEALVDSMGQGDLPLDLHCQSMKTFPYVNQAIEDRRAKVGCNEQGEIGGIEIRLGRRRVWIGSLQSWGMKVATVGAAMTIRRFCDYMGEGTRQSPAAVGQTSMRRLISQPTDGHWRRKVPSWRLRELLRQGGVGGRVDTWVGPGDYFPVVWEIDFDNAYLWGLGNLPDGMPAMISHPETLMNEQSDGRLTARGQNLGTWFGQAVVKIPEQGLSQQVGPFPWRDQGRDTYPVKPGWYGDQPDRPLFLWKEEVEDCLKAGIMVWLKGPQWAWLKMTNALKPWADHMAKLRQEAPTELEGLCKLAIVAGIGWHGQKAQVRQVLPLKDVNETNPELLCTVGDGATPKIYSVDVRHRESMPYMTHWYWHDQMNVRRQVRSLVLRSLKLGDTVIATNFDSVLIVSRSKMTLAVIPPHARLHEGRVWDDGPSYKVSRLTNVTVPYPRAIVAEEKVRLPGTVRTS